MLLIKYVVVEDSNRENIFAKTIVLVTKKSLLYRLTRDDIKNQATM